MTGRVYPTIGIDVGERWVALAARIDGRCLDATTLDRGHGPARGEERYLGQLEPERADLLLGAVDLIMRRHLDAATEAAAQWDTPPVDLPWRVAVEGIVVTGGWEGGKWADPKLRIAKLVSLVGTAVPFGTIVGHFPGAVVVRPRKLGDRGHARHGDALASLGPYPPELTGRRPRHFLASQHFKGDRTHERAAWAVAGAAQLARPLTLAPQELVS